MASGSFINWVVMSMGLAMKATAGAAPAPFAPAARFCSSCGAALQPGARFCATCGAAQEGLASPAPSPAPRPVIPSQQPPPPAPGPVYGPRPTPPPAPAPSQPAAAPRRSPGCGKGCAITCGVLTALFVLLIVGCYWAVGKFILSRPAAFVGRWQVVEGKSKIGEKFELGLTASEDGVKLLSVDGHAMPNDVVFRAGGMRTVVGALKNPKSLSPSGEVTAELNGFGTMMTLTAKEPSGKIDIAEAKRDLGL